jgi:hypothetical protein
MTPRTVSRALLAVLALAAGTLAARAQRGQAEINAYLSSGVVKLGAEVALVVSVENARTAEIAKLPSVPGLAFGAVGAPAEHRFVQMTPQGTHSSVSRTWTVRLRPEDVGEYAIPPVELLVDGEPRKTRELELNVVADLRGEDLGFLEIRPSSSRVIVGQPFSIEILFGFDDAIRDRTNYANLALSWWGRLPGLLENGRPDAGAGKLVEVLINDSERAQVEVAERERRGRPFVELRLLLSFTPTRTGTLEIPTSFFEFGQTRDRRDFFSQRREKVESFFARSEALSIEVVPLPEAGRPLDFGGAIGNLEVRASAEPRDVDAGESIKLALEWTGEGNLEFFTAPDLERLDSFKEFRVYGKNEERSFDRRSVVYDLAPISSRPTEIPPVPLHVYDPRAGRYTVVQSDPIPIRVRALERDGGLARETEERRFEKDVRDVVDRPGPRRDASPLAPAPFLGIVASLPIAWLALRGAVRRRSDPDAPAERARRKARRRLARELAKARDARARLDALHGFLAMRTGESREAWIGRRVSGGAGSASPEAVKPLDEAIAELEGAVWGGRAEAVTRERLLRAADEAVRGGL